MRVDTETALLELTVAHGLQSSAARVDCCTLIQSSARARSRSIDRQTTKKGMDDCVTDIFLLFFVLVFYFYLRLAVLSSSRPLAYSDRHTIAKHVRNRPSVRRKGGTFSVVKGRAAPAIDARSTRGCMIEPAASIQQKKRSRHPTLSLFDREQVVALPRVLFVSGHPQSPIARNQNKNHWQLRMIRFFSKK